MRACPRASEDTAQERTLENPSCCESSPLAGWQRGNFLLRCRRTDRRTDGRRPRKPASPKAAKPHSAEGGLEGRSTLCPGAGREDRRLLQRHPAGEAALPRAEGPPPAATPPVRLTLGTCSSVECGTRRGAIAPALRPSCNPGRSCCLFGPGDQRPSKVLLGSVCSENKLTKYWAKFLFGAFLLCHRKWAMRYFPPLHRN